MRLYLCSEVYENIEFKIKDLEVYDPITEILPSRIQSNKQHCPKCNVPVTDIGTRSYSQTSFNHKYYKKIKDGILILIL